jgi:hypothetical protein
MVQLPAKSNKSKRKLKPAIAKALFSLAFSGKFILPKQPNKNPKARYSNNDLDEFCLWLYGIYEEGEISTS